jgi:hypothetical protein
MPIQNAAHFGEFLRDGIHGVLSLCRLRFRAIGPPGFCFRYAFLRVRLPSGAGSFPRTIDTGAENPHCTTRLTIRGDPKGPQAEGSGLEARGTGIQAAGRLFGRVSSRCGGRY